MKASGLRGRGGAGFPTGMKWSFVPKQSAKPKYVLVNGDESEPGTCKDHLIFLHDPARGHRRHHHRRAWPSAPSWASSICAASTAICWKLWRRPSPTPTRAAFSARNIFGSETEFQIITQTGAGAYEVGEESALMESLEGKRGDSAHQAALPCRRRPLRRAYSDQQRRDHRHRAARDRDGRRGLCRGGFAAQWRDAFLQHQRPR